MKTIIAILMITAFVSTILAAPFRLEEPGYAVRKTISIIPIEKPTGVIDTPFCRRFKGPARCVDEPLKIVDAQPWCPYRMCGPSYVRAALCPVDRDVQATDKCKEEYATRTIYKCDGKQFGRTLVPVGCTEGTKGCIEVTTCSCIAIENYTSKVLTQIAPFTPDCEPKR